MKISRIVEMELPVPLSAMPQATVAELRRSPWLFPDFIGEGNTLSLTVHSLLVEAPGLKLVVDTCVGNDRPREITGDVPLATPFLQHLAEAGWARDEVDAVVCTHLHVDHVGWNTMLQNDRWVPTFPNARYFIGRVEYQFWKAHTDAEQQAMLGDSIKPVIDAGLAHFVEVDHVIAPEVRLTPSIGHTPGHVSVIVESDGERAVITGDMLHHPCQLAHPDWFFGDNDVDEAVRTRRQLFAEWADQKMLMIGSHFPAPTAGYIVRDAGAFKLSASAPST